MMGMWGIGHVPEIFPSANIGTSLATEGVLA
jgi:hypothetical protein